MLQSSSSSDRALRRVSITTAILSLFALAACEGEVERGVAPPDPRFPAIVSLNPCLDAMLVEIATAPQVLGLSHYSRDPGSSSIPLSVSRRYRTIGGTAEEVMALDPDIVLASSFIAPATRRAFERAGIRVETFDSPTSIDQSIAQVERIGLITRQEKAADKLVRRIRAAPSASAGERSIAALVWQPGQIVAGKDTLLHELLNRSGFTSHAEAQGLKQADHVALETVLANPPEILLVAGDSAGQHHPVLRSAPEIAVARFDPQLIYCGGPTIPRAATRLAEIRREVLR